MLQTFQRIYGVAVGVRVTVGVELGVLVKVAVDVKEGVPVGVTVEVLVGGLDAGVWAGVVGDESFLHPVKATTNNIKTADPKTCKRMALPFVR
jgi:hypothetical protein